MRDMRPVYQKISFGNKNTKSETLKILKLAITNNPWCIRDISKLEGRLFRLNCLGGNQDLPLTNSLFPPTIYSNLMKGH